MRDGIHKLLAWNGIETTLLRGYHESVTRVWIHTCDAFLRESGIEGPEAVRSLVASYGHRNQLHREYYSYDVLTSKEARYDWQPPDLRPLPAAWRRGSRWISCNPRFLNIGMIHAFLSGTYWSPEIPRQVVERAIRGALSFGIYDQSEQVGFARVITDYATYAYIGDVFVLEANRRQGLSVWLMECILAHPSLQGLRRWQLSTRDAHGLYRKFGFQPPARPEGLMEIAKPDIYKAV